MTAGHVSQNNDGWTNIALVILKELNFKKGLSFCKKSLNFRFNDFYEKGTQISWILMNTGLR